MVDLTLTYAYTQSHKLNDAKTKLAKLIKQHRTKAKIKQLRLWFLNWVYLPHDK
jgi:hypothetical protein